MKASTYDPTLYSAAAEGISRLRRAGTTHLLAAPAAAADDELYIAPGWEAGAFLAVADRARATRTGGRS